MIVENALKVKTYKCFGEVPQGFERILPINIIIGKNNSGKSTLIDLIEFFTNPQQDLLQTQNTLARCIVELKITNDILEAVAREYAQRTGNSDPTGWILAIKEHSDKYILHKEVIFEYNKELDLNFISQKNDYGQYVESFKSIFTSFARGKKFRRINAERDITAEVFSPRDNFAEGGSGATNVIWKLLAIKGSNQNLIKKKFLQSLNKVINPDIKFVDIIIKEDSQEDRKNASGEIFFEIENGAWVALSKMGSGIKTIILTLLNLIVIPKIDRIDKSNYVFGFEELENNLHPSLLRRLFNFIINYSSKNNSYFFITTHSSIVIDLFSSDKNAQIIHLENIDNKSICRTLHSHLDGRNVLKDLDYKPSDLLLSNGVVWVEGPSDAIYLELLIDLYKKQFNILVTLNFCIQSLSTAIWKYAGFSDFDWDKLDNSLENQIISLAKVNHNHLIVIDKDYDYENDKPSNWGNFKNGTGRNKARLINESLRFAGYSEELLENNFGDSNNGMLLFWINEGTFESYLEYFIQNKGNVFRKYFSARKGTKHFEKKRDGKDSSKSKVELAAEIAQYILSSELTIYDIAPTESSLFNKIPRLVETIKIWNKILCSIIVPQ